MAKISFKSVGELEQDRKKAQQVEQSPIGFKTPLRITEGGREGIFAMHYTLADQIQDNLRNLLLTNHGDRLVFYDYGANLQELATELGAQDADTEAITRIAVAIKKYMPYIVPQTFEAAPDRVDNQHVAKVRIRLTYDVPTLSAFNRAIEVTLYAVG